MHRTLLSVLIAVCLAFVALPAHAYLDPASGSLLLQMILGGVAGIALAVKLYWHRLLAFFGAKKSPEDEDPV